MAYKVLGQATSTAPASELTYTNYVKDSSFAAYSFSSTVTGTSISALKTIDSSSPWRFQPNSSTSYRLTNAIIEGVSPAFGTNSYGMTGAGWLVQGSPAGVNASSTPSNSTFLDTATAVPVVAGTTYQLGWSYRNASGTDSMNFSVYWFNSSYGYISSASKTQSIAASNTWYRYTSTVTAPADAVYGVLNFYVGGGSWLLDGVVFGPSSTYATTFTEPYFPAIAAAQSPYTNKISGYISDSYLVFSGSAPAGALNTLYTVPAGKSAVVSTLAITNLGTATQYRVAVIPSGDTLSQENWLFFDVPIAATSTQAITIGMTLAAGDVVKIAANSGYVSATLFGSES